MSSIFYNDGFEVTPDLKRFKNLTVFVIFPLILLIGGIPLFILMNYLWNNDYYNMNPPLWGIKNLSKVLMVVGPSLYATFLIPLLGGPLLTWFKVRRSNLLHAVVIVSIKVKD